MANPGAFRIGQKCLPPKVGMLCGSLARAETGPPYMGLAPRTVEVRVRLLHIPDHVWACPGWSFGVRRVCMDSVG